MSVTEEIKHLKLGDITSLSQGLAINSKTKHLLKNKGIPLLRITDLINNEVEQYIDELHLHGIKVMIKPQIWVSKGEFTGKIEMKSAADWSKFENGYTSFILSFAKILVAKSI